MSTEGHPDQERIFAVWEGEVDGEEAARITEHLSACPDCRAYAEQLERGSSLFGEYRRQFLRELPPAPGGWRAGLQPAVVTPLWKRRGVWWLAGAAALLVAVAPVRRLAQEQERADAELLKKVDRQLSESVPESLNPLLKLVACDGEKGEEQ